MSLLIVIVAGLLPAVALLAYVCWKDPRPEPWPLLLKATLYGVMICLPVSLCELAVLHTFFGGQEPVTFFGSTAEAFLVAAIPEESFKLFALWLILRRNPYFDEHFDGLVYAVCVGLGFAAIENVVYLFADLENWRATAVARALLAVPGHYAFAVMMGYYYSVWHFCGRTRRAAVSALLVPVMAHGVYDMLALSEKTLPETGVLSFFILIFFCFKLQKHASQKIMAQVKRDTEQTTFRG